MERRYYAIVKMDDFNSTKSTGGVVMEIKYWLKNESDRAFADSMSHYPSNYQLIPCGENVKVGWIYTDKTNFFIDSNYSTNK
jgi:hypothetical protein